MKVTTAEAQEILDLEVCLGIIHHIQFHHPSRMFRSECLLMYDVPSGETDPIKLMQDGLMVMTLIGIKRFVVLRKPPMRFRSGRPTGVLP